MGGNSSKAENSEALKMCKLRKKLIKQAIDSRYNIAAAHISYTQTLKNIGVALRRFAEAEMLLESSLVSPSQIVEYDADVASNSRLSYMKSGANNAAFTFRYNPDNNSHNFVDNRNVNAKVNGGDNVNGTGNDDETMVFPPPPPPPPEGGSWDYFDTGVDEGESFRFVGLDKIKAESVKIWGEEEGKTGNSESGDVVDVEKNEVEEENEKDEFLERSGSRIDKCKGGIEKDVSEEREDASEFITHRAKDFLSSIKDIENRFFRASEAGKEVARMLEANRIRVGYAVAKGSSSPLDALAAYPLVCCRGESVHASNDLQSQSAPKVIVWKRSMSSHSSSSRNPLATPRDDASDSGSECLEDFFMISGSHSSSLERLYAWERKLYDEVKASEVIRKDYDRKCDQLRRQFAKDVSTHVIDKTRAAVKDLHSRIRVALHSVDSIAKRIEKMRDEELLPQLTELITGFIRMWKAMLECHHAQYITISLAYHAKTAAGNPVGDRRKEIMAQLHYEFECFGISFADWMNSLTSYVEALNGWLLNCIILPQERTRGSRRPFSPRRVLAPPIFGLCRDWSVGIRALPSEDVSDAIRDFLTDLHHLTKQQGEEENKGMGSQENGENVQGKDEEHNSNGKSANLGCIHTSLSKVLDKLTKFSEASLKLYEEIQQKTEVARVAYSKPRPVRY